MKTLNTVLGSVLVVSLFTVSLAPADASGLSKAVRTAENMEPAVPQPEQEKAVAQKLAALYEKTGKRPNIVWLVVDDMGYGDPGVFGGGVAIGAVCQRA